MKICIRSLSVFIILTMLSSCWDGWELNQISIIGGLAIDQGEDGNYVMNMQVINPSELAIKEEAAGLSPVSVYEVSAPTIHEAGRKVLMEAPRRAYYSHMASLIISEEIAEEGLEDVMDFFYRDHEVRSDYMILVSKDGPARDILEMVPRIEGVGSVNIMHSIEHGMESYALIDGVKMGELLKKTLSDGIEPTLLGVSAVGNIEKSQTVQNIESTKPKGHRKLDSTAIFRNNRLVGWLNESESKAFQYADGSVQETVESVPCPNQGTMGIESQRIEPEIVVTMDEGHPIVQLNIEIDGSISEFHCPDLDLLQESTFKKVEEQNNKEVIRMLENMLETLQSQRADALGFGSEIHRQVPQYWKTIDDWPKIFSDLQIDISVHTSIEGIGEIGNSFNLKEN